MQLRTDPSQESELSRGFWPLSSCKPSAGRLTGTWSPRRALCCTAPRRAVWGSWKFESWGGWSQGPSALLLVFEHQADSSADVLACYLPTPPSQNDHPDCCPETEKSGNKWRPIREKQGRLRHSNRGHCPRAMEVLEEEVGATSPYLSKISLISGSWECGYMALFGFSLEQLNKGRRWGKFCLLCSRSGVAE